MALIRRPSGHVKSGVKGAGGTLGSASYGAEVSSSRRMVVGSVVLGLFSALPSALSPASARRLRLACVAWARGTCCWGGGLDIPVIDERSWAVYTACNAFPAMVFKSATTLTILLVFLQDKAVVRGRVVEQGGRIPV